MQYHDGGGMRHTAYCVAGDLSNGAFKGGQGIMSTPSVCGGVGFWMSTAMVA
jgi:hypothetical protein